MIPSPIDNCRRIDITLHSDGDLRKPFQQARSSDQTRQFKALTSLGRSFGSCLMLTFKERYPQSSCLPSDPLFNQRNDETVKFRAADPYNVARGELAAMQVLDREIRRYQKTKQCTPLPIPSKTGYSYSDWCQHQAVKSAIGKATTCLSMRVSQRQSHQSAPVKTRSNIPFP
jgi:hypothetical protein